MCSFWIPGHRFQQHALVHLANQATVLQQQGCSLREELAIIHVLPSIRSSRPQGAVGHDVEPRPGKLLADRKEDYREIAITICRNPVWVGVQDQGLICLSLCGNGFNAVAKSGWHNEQRCSPLRSTPRQPRSLPWSSSFPVRVSAPWSTFRVLDSPNPVGLQFMRDLYHRKRCSFEFNRSTVTTHLAGNLLILSLRHFAPIHHELRLLLAASQVQSQLYSTLNFRVSVPLVHGRILDGDHCRCEYIHTLSFSSCILVGLSPRVWSFAFS